MINTNIFISPGASGLAEVHLQHVAYGNQVTTSKGDTRGILGDVVQAAVVSSCRLEVFSSRVSWKSSDC